MLSVKPSRTTNSSAAQEGEGIWPPLCTGSLGSAHDSPLRDSENRTHQNAQQLPDIVDGQNVVAPISECRSVRRRNVTGGLRLTAAETRPGGCSGQRLGVRRLGDSGWGEDEPELGAGQVVGEKTVFVASSADKLSHLVKRLSH